MPRGAFPVLLLHRIGRRFGGRGGGFSARAGPWLGRGGRWLGWLGGGGLFCFGRRRSRGFLGGGCGRRAHGRRCGFGGGGRLGRCGRSGLRGSRFAGGGLGSLSRRCGGGPGLVRGRGGGDLGARGIGFGGGRFGRFRRLRLGRRSGFGFLYGLRRGGLRVFG